MGLWLNSITVYVCSKYTNDLAWRVPIVTQVIPPSLLLIALIFLPESPTWLLLKGRHEEAAKSFRRFNGANFDVAAAIEVAAVAIAKEEDAKKEQQSSSWLECFQGTNLRRTLIIVMVYISQQAVGVAFVSGYLT